MRQLKTKFANNNKLTGYLASINANEGSDASHNCYLFNCGALADHSWPALDQLKLLQGAIGSDMPVVLK